MRAYPRRNPNITPIGTTKEDHREFREIRPWPVSLAFRDAESVHPLDDAPWRFLPPPAERPVRLSQYESDQIEES
jgi:hypothetical protein